MQKIPVSAILMDVDGTMTAQNAARALTRSPLEHLAALTARDHKCSVEKAVEMIQSCGDINTHCLSEFLDRLKVSRQEYFDSLVGDLEENIVITDDTVRFFQNMQKKDIPVSTATTNSEFMTYAKLAVGKLADISGSPFIARCHGGNEFGDPKGKFSENFYPNIIKNHPYDPASVMMIGDEALRDALPALAAGIGWGVTIDRNAAENIIVSGRHITVNSLDNLLPLIEKA